MPGMYEIGADDELGADDEVGGDEEFGGEEVIGADEEYGGVDLFGAARPRRRARGRVAGRPAGRQMPSGKRLIQTGPTKERKLPLGFSSAAVQPGGTVTIEVSPPVDVFRAEELTIPPSIAQYFDIIDIKVGKDSQFLGGKVSAENYVPTATTSRITMDPATSNRKIYVTVQNKHNAAHDFEGTFTGYAAF